MKRLRNLSKQQEIVSAPEPTEAAKEAENKEKPKTRISPAQIRAQKG